MATSEHLARLVEELEAALVATRPTSPREAALVAARVVFPRMRALQLELASAEQQAEGLATAVEDQLFTSAEQVELLLAWLRHRGIAEAVS